MGRFHFVGQHVQDTEYCCVFMPFFLSSAFIPGQAPKKIFKCIGMNVSKAKIEDNKLKVSGKELTYYLDPTTGAKLDRWDNPWTEEKGLPGT